MTYEFQSPSLRGSGRFRAARLGGELAEEFQSPSLRGSGRFPAAPVLRPSAPRRFNPLHCGAVVASGRQPFCAHFPGTRLNPLHCGAVVASHGGRRRGRARKPVSIPFIAGQWSLRRMGGEHERERRKSQSPSLRGSGRFCPSPHGGWARRDTSQSPSLRGSGRFRAALRARQSRFSSSQSPSLRGSGRFESLPPPKGGAIRVSIPFIAGQWSLPPAAGGRGFGEERCLNPLHCGAVVASGQATRATDRVAWSQSPSLRGSGRFKRAQRPRRERGRKSQSPSLRGSGRFVCAVPTASGGRA